MAGTRLDFEDPFVDGGAERRLPSRGAMAGLLTTAQVAELLAVSERTVKRLVAGHRLPCVRIGRAVRFDYQAVFRWLEARQEGG
jgi:excisionase family DNA binding protein